MISFSSGNSLLNYLTAQNATTTTTTTTTTDSGGAASGAGMGAAAKAKMAATTQAALQVAAAKPQMSAAGHTLANQQAALAADLRAAMGKAGVQLAGTVEFSVGSDGKVALNGSDADKAATSAFLKSDASRPSFADRIGTQATDALKLSTTIQQNVAISQAARYSSNPSGVMAMYTSMMQQAGAATSAVFSVSAGTSALTYPGSLTAKA